MEQILQWEPFLVSSFRIKSILVIITSFTWFIDGDEVLRNVCPQVAARCDHVLVEMSLIPAHL